MERRKFDVRTQKERRTFDGLLPSQSTRMHSGNSLSIGNHQDVHKSSGVEMTMSMEGDQDIYSHKLDVTFDPRRGTFAGLPASYICWLNPDNSLSNNTEQDINKTLCEKMTKSTNGYPNISLPRDLIHKLHVTYDPHTREFVGSPASCIARLNSHNSLSIKNDMDIYKSSGIKNFRHAEQEIYPPMSVRRVDHLRLDSASRESTGTHTAMNDLFNSSAIPVTHMYEHGEALLGAMGYNNATKESAVYAHLPSRIGFPIPVLMASRSCNNTRSASGNMRADIDHTEAVYIHKQLSMLAESVGIIISPTVCGTGFSIGPSYVMTAKHVLDEIIKETPTVLTNTMKPSNELRLQSSDVYIDFEYERNGQPSDGKHRFYFEPDILYANDNLDTVILKLKPDARMYPQLIIQFSPLSEQTSHGYFVGHPKADIKRTDKYECVTLTPYDINAAKRWSLSQAGVDGFVGIDDPHRVLLHCTFGKGASGTPGFWICPNNGQAYVVLMLVRGYPDWYYDDKHPAATKAGIPSNHLVEQGVTMESIYRDMKDNAYHLWEDIFCCV